jgi:hypothetical protein
MDKIISLSAFGDDIQEPALQNKEPNGVTYAKSDSSDKSIVFSMILKNMAQTKLLHWQSLRYGQHKALDKLFDGIIDHGDNLAESIMGKYGRPVLSEDALCLKIKNYSNPESEELTDFMDHLYKFYSLEAKSAFSQDTDSEIVNILDEIIALIDKTKYLLTLK